MSRPAGADGAAVPEGVDAAVGLAAARVLLPEGDLRPAVVWIDPSSGTIASVSEDPGARGDRVVQLGDVVLAPGFVDLHVHGGAGRQVNGDAADEVEESVGAIAAFHVQHGTTSLLATTVSDSPGRLAASVEGVARAARGSGRRRPDAGVVTSAARVLGAHLEGPFVSPAHAGAQDPAGVRPPDPDELARLLEIGAGTVRIVTVAPELEGAGRLMTVCLDAAAAVSLGHTDAGYECARAAFDAGASHVTHLFNAMAPLHHRAPGLAGAALVDGSVTVEVICDLHHLHPAVVALVDAAAPGRTVLVTDATAAAGMPSGPLVLGRLDAVLDGTKVTLASDPRVLAGSALTMDRAVRHAVRDAHVTLESALRSASTVPAGVLARAGALVGVGAGIGLGTIAPGAPADIVVLDADLEVVTTVVAGRVAFGRAGYPLTAPAASPDTTLRCTMTKRSTTGSV